jgi:hypothetical protein
MPAGTGGGGGAAEPPVKMHAEAGFVDVPAQLSGPTDHARVFYSFQPADEHPERAPLVILFNGGPGSATTSILLPFGTGPMTLRADDPDDAPPVPNEASFTRFANLLYVDERSTGYSYDLGTGCAGTSNDVTDAGDFVFTLLAFLDAHAPLVNNPVVVMGESYGGTRAPVMLYLLQHYAGDSPAPSGMPDPATMLPWLHERVQTHLDLAFPERKGQVSSVAEVSAQFGWEVLIQPSLAGDAQQQYQAPLMANDPIFSTFLGTGAVALSGYDVRRTVEQMAAVERHAGHMARDPQAMSAQLGVALADIVSLAAAERGAVVRQIEPDALAAVVKDEAALRGSLGQLGEHDAYWLSFVNHRCGYFLGDGGSGNAFYSGLTTTQVFITNARYDGVVYTPAIPGLLGMGGSEVVLDESAPAGAERPGVIRFSPANGAPISIRFPRYESGHEVTLSAAAAFGADVEAWLHETGALLP